MLELLLYLAQHSTQTTRELTHPPSTQQRSRRPRAVPSSSLWGPWRPPWCCRTFPRAPRGGTWCLPCRAQCPLPRPRPSCRRTMRALRRPRVRSTCWTSASPSAPPPRVSGKEFGFATFQTFYTNRAFKTGSIGSTILPGIVATLITTRSRSHWIRPRTSECLIVTP